MKKLLFDTNYFLRYLLNDIPDQVREVEALLQEAESQEIQIYVPQIVIFEVHFGLMKFYGLKKEEVIKKLQLLVSTPYLQIESRSVFKEALRVYKNANLSFTDCFILAKSHLNGSTLMTFDKKLAALAKESKLK